MDTNIITSLEAEIEKLKIDVFRLACENQELRKLNEWYAERFKIAQQQRFGASSEKNMLPGQLELFNEAEVCADEKLPEPEAEIITYKRKKQKGKRDEFFSNLPTVQRVHELPESERICPLCNGDLHACGHEVYRREIEVIPATVRAVEHVQTVYACRECKTNTDKNDKNSAVPMLKAQVPAPVISGSGIASPSLVAFVLVNKYLLALPLNRQEQELKRQNITISRQTMANWCLYAAEKWLCHMIVRLLEKMLTYYILHSDDTRLQVINEPNRKATTDSYFWVYMTGLYAQHQIVLFEYTETREGKHPQKFLADYAGFLNVDGYQGYYALENNGVTLCGCWAHARRKFVDTLKTIPKEQHKDAPASVGLAYCDKLFELERKFDKQGLTPEQRCESRAQESMPVALACFAWAEKVLPSLSGKSKLREAVIYLGNQRARLMNFLSDGRIEISNNRAERAIRPFTIGRNNWLFAYSPRGAKASAIIYSIVETAKANGLVPFKYLEFLFETMPNIPESRFDECLPWDPAVKARCSADT